MLFLDTISPYKGLNQVSFTINTNKTKKSQAF